MHAAYNVQLIVSKGLILGVYTSQDRSDYLTLIPVCNRFKDSFGEFPTNCIADSGYGSYSNYLFLDNNKIGNYVKYPSWEGEKTGKRPALFKIVNENIVCLKNNIGVPTELNDRHPKKSNSMFYKFTGCSNCLYKKYCKRLLKIKNESFRIAEINKDYLKEIAKVRANLLSPKGIEVRVNRSIQVEGDFGNIKENMNYDRFRRRGLKNVETEISLVALGVNIRKFFRFIDKGTVPDFWIAPKDLKADTFNKISISKPRNKSVNEKNREKYKRKRAVKPLDSKI